jgi:hypothetical protein
MAVDGAKTVGASAAAMGAKAADGAKSVGASAVVSCVLGCCGNVAWVAAAATSKLTGLCLCSSNLFSTPPLQAIGSKGIATASSKLKQPASQRELLSSPHLYKSCAPPVHKCNTCHMYVPRFKYTPCVKTGPFYTMFAPPPPPPPLALCIHLCTTPASHTLGMSGMIGLDPATRVLVSGGPYAEAKQVSAPPIPNAEKCDNYVSYPWICDAKRWGSSLARRFCRCCALRCPVIAPVPRHPPPLTLLSDWGLSLEHLVGKRRIQNIIRTYATTP